MPSIKDNQGRDYWRSLNDYAETPEFQEFMAREFSPSASELLAPSTRRDFLKVMGASLALAGLGLTGCRWPEEKIAPFAHQPEGFIPGTAVSFATAMELGGHAVGLLVTSYDGRPIKIEGNPLHPESLGRTNAWHQASILDLYDIDRSKTVVDRSQGSEGQQAESTAFLSAANDAVSQAAGAMGAGLAFLFEPSSSPSLARLRRQITTALPYAKQYDYAPLSQDNAREGSRIAFGQPNRQHLNLKDVAVVASFAADFTHDHPASIKYTMDFMPGRRGDAYQMNRLYVVEADYSPCGSIADHRIPVRSSQIAAALGQLAGELISQGLSLPASAATLGMQLSSGAGNADSAAQIKALATDLLANRGRSAVIVGDSQPPAVHALGILLNEALGNFGRTVTFSTDPDPQRRPAMQQITELSAAITAGDVSTLFIFGGNPVYNAPADIDFAGKLAQVSNSFHLSSHDDETSALCKWHAPRANYLEAWGDALAWDGTYSIVQPLIAPFYGGMSDIELLARLLRMTPASGYEIVRETFRGFGAGGDFERNWERCLHDGVLADSASPQSASAGGYNGLAAGLSAVQASSDGFELLLGGDPSVYDGRFANNGWMQECPDPMTKVTWDNTLNISYADSQEMGIRHGDMLSLTAGSVSLDLPAYIMPGLPKGQLVARLGYGRTRCGEVGDGVGFDTYKLLSSQSPGQLAGVSISKTGASHEIAETQDHFVIDQIGFKEREERSLLLVREANIDEYKIPEYHASHAVHHPELLSLWKEHEYTGHRWAMAIDLALCSGCNACVVACQAENNIPVVGKLRVIQGREMHWLRIDRYFRGDPANPRSVTMPVTCHHCENAPCEQVCPVGATAHSHEGLNDMVYNRCIGTRYCSNNCPYKVRRFNWFSFQRNFSETQKLQLNPEVTVRSRGVMEKCSYCVQRIQKVKIAAKNEGRAIQDGEIVTACQQACPADAIVFGDLADPNSRVSLMQDELTQRRSYALLAELNTKPRTKYLSRLRNPAPGTPEAEIHYFEGHGGGHGEEHSEHVIEINGDHATVGHGDGEH